MTGMRLVRVLGFDIRADFSWFILFFLILWTFTTGVFPANAPGLARHIYGIMGLSGALLFFGSLVAHELSHSIVARTKGIPVEGITLFLFGGMAHTRTEAKTPGDEFQIAVVGPVTSVVVAVLLGGLALFGERAGWSAAPVVVLRYIAYLNVALAVFNLLPGFPLDGGRLFRAVVWKLTGNPLKATRIASATGRWLGYGLMALGLYSVFTGSVIGGMWLVFIGWFLRNAAISSYQQHVLLSVLAGVKAGQAMTAQPVVVPADATVRDVMDVYLMRHPYSAYPVVERGRAEGMVTLSALQAVPQDEWDIRTARDIMVPLTYVVTVKPDDNMLTVLERLKGSPARRVLVLDNGELLGIITARDVAAWLERARQERK